MKRIILLLAASATLTGCLGGGYGGDYSGYSAPITNGSIDQYGRPITIVPAFGGGNAYGSVIQKQDAYGLGVHMDQYGRAVRTMP